MTYDPENNMTPTVRAAQKYITGTAEDLEQKSPNIDLSADIYAGCQAFQNMISKIGILGNGL